MRNLYVLGIALALALGIPAQAQISEEEFFKSRVEAITKQIEALQQKLEDLQKGNSTSGGTSDDDDTDETESADTTKSKLKLMYRLDRGASGEDVRVLQKILASDPTIYPEGLITGFFGPLTEAAVKRFQAKVKIEQVGAVGPQTLARINEILSAAGVIGNVPADLLNSKVKIEIEIKDGKEEVKIEIKCDSSGPGNPCKDDDDEEDDDDDDSEDDDDDSDEDEDEDSDDDEDDSEDDD